MGVYLTRLGILRSGHLDTTSRLVLAYMTNVAQDHGEDAAVFYGGQRMIAVEMFPELTEASALRKVKRSIGVLTKAGLISNDGTHAHRGCRRHYRITVEMLGITDV